LGFGGWPSTATVFQMKLLSWNCQGLGNPLTIQALKVMVACDKPDFVFLMETKKDKHFVSKIQRKFKFSHSFVKDPVGLKGGLALFWNDNFEVTLVHSDVQFVDFVALDPRTNSSMHITCLHAPPIYQLRQEFWNTIRVIHAANHLPWLCIGDFNDFLSPWEKMGKRPAITSRMTSFQNVINDCALLELQSKGCEFTWSNNREGDALVKEKLDRVFCSLEWLTSYPSAEAFALPSVGSDHCPILLQARPSSVKRAKTFQYEAFWNQDKECKDMVQQAWENSSTSLMSKLQAVATRLTRWSRARFSNCHQRIYHLQSQLQMIINRTSYQEGDKEYANAIRCEIQKLWTQDEQFWAMRSRIQWLKWGDHNSKFFHAYTMQRRQRNRITMLVDTHQQWIREPEQLKELTQGFFSQLYRSVGYRDFRPFLDQCPPVVTPEMNTHLMSRVTEEEIYQATFQLGASKAPGPDGLPGLFYRHHWHVIKATVIQTVQDFFTTGCMPPTLNRTIIALVPKVQHPESIEQYRPISLCNFAYKIISKIMANRLKPLLSILISKEQAAFISNRQIQDNIMVVQEVMHQFKVRACKKHFNLILKTDMQKAYDRVEWDFLEAYLKQLGFNDSWVTQVMACVTTVSFSIRFNGEQLPYFKPTRGIRQGDPLSPYLFILIANALSTTLTQAVAIGHIKGIQFHRDCPKLCHLFFADDSVFFLKATISECHNLANLLNQYCVATGQLINRNKYGVFFSKNCPNSLQHNLAQELRVPILNKYGKYLGIPSDWGRSTREMFSWILARVNAKLAGWQDQFLSKSGKEILLKSVI